MGTEIERKFLVTDPSWRAAASAPVPIRQGYLSRDPKRVVRVRTKGAHAFLTIKSPLAGEGALTRSEFEYEIPPEDAVHLLDHVCLTPILTKKRYHITGSDGLTWEVDEFVSPHPGFVLAEIELPNANAPFERPSWLGREVTHDARYANNNIGTAVLD